MSGFLVTAIIVAAIVGVIYKLSTEKNTATANALSSVPNSFFNIIYG